MKALKDDLDRRDALAMSKVKFEVKSQIAKFEEDNLFAKDLIGGTSKYKTVGQYLQALNSKMKKDQQA